MDKSLMSIPKVKVTGYWTPPQWALMERHILDMLNAAALEFVERYVREDGTLIWRDRWPGMDGSDDPYEGFMNLALLYTLGGSEEVYRKAREIWEGITWQWTEYGQIDREFDGYYDWMHHGEGYLYFYFLGLTKPNVLKDRQRAMRFANFYTGKDPKAPNYDEDQKLIRSPLTGSRGPRFEVTAEDWCTHRGVLDDYLAPFEDIPGVDFASMTCAWSNDEVYAEVLKRMNERMNRGDVPLNLNATGLITHAYMYTADESYRQWVLDYLRAWEERTERNGGLIPDNIGLSGEIGEYNDGKWWGGYYGWRWPHGFMTIIEPLTNACMNALLLTGDDRSLQLVRSQLDRNWELGKDIHGSRKVPYKHFDAGWTDYRFPMPKYPVYLWTASMQEEDLERIERIPRDHDWNEIIVPKVSGRDKETGRDTKHYIGNTLPWFQYMRGALPDYPERILEANIQLIAQQLEKMRSQAGDPHEWDKVAQEASGQESTVKINMNVDGYSIHAWQEFCPVYFEGLLQLTLGGPMHISHGGLQHGRVRYYDGQKKRPGLPDSVAALVEQITADAVTIQVVNLHHAEARELIIQAGTFGEHRFEEALIHDQQGHIVGQQAVGGKWFGVELEPNAGAKLELQMKRYVNKPTYETPWHPIEDFTATIQGRNQA
jgi:hypothetical protein